MTATLRTLLRMSIGAVGFTFILAAGSAFAQDQGTQHRTPSPLFVPAIGLIGAGAYLAYRRSRPTN
jgi:hypothetical protein